MIPEKIVQQLQASVSKDKWQRIGIRRRSGAVVPLFSVYSKKSLGIGEIGDLHLLVDWAQKTGNSVLQLLPMNEMGGDFCPYDSVSSFALDPAYISLDGIEGAQDKQIQERLRQARERFPAGKPFVDYGIKAEKLRILEDLFFRQGRYESDEFASFRKENYYWLQDFALFQLLKARHAQQPWYSWPQPLRERDPQALERYLGTHEKEVRFYMWVQWLLQRQFVKAREYARQKNVLIKGDLPILVSRDSADVWAHREFFKLDCASGAPPDMYCAKGQRWGMPCYDWEAIAAQDYRYLREKLRYAEQFYDILRIDHIVGLFRIWSIPYNDPLENQGLNGAYDPPQQAVWGEHGRKILQVILSHTRMLLCGEDLGTIPKVCPQTMEEFGIPGNDVARWNKDWAKRHDFLAPQEYRALAVAMLSTHDTTNWLAWWENEAGTIDEALFARKCQGRVDYGRVRGLLFDETRSRFGRLRWRESISSVQQLVTLLGRPAAELADFIELYENSFGEKEKLWKAMGLAGRMREKGDADILAAALALTLESSALFCFQLITDWLGAGDLLPGDPAEYRFNFPGTVSPRNWSQVLPVSLETLLKHPVCERIRTMIERSSRGA